MSTGAGLIEHDLEFTLEEIGDRFFILVRVLPADIVAQSVLCGLPAFDNEVP